MSTVEMLISARAIMVRDGYARFTRGGGGEPHCILGALDATYEDCYSDWVHTRKDAINVLASLAPATFKAKISWHDPNFHGDPGEIAYITSMRSNSAKLAFYNNYTNQKTMLELFDKAIASLQVQAMAQKAEETDLIEEEIKAAEDVKKVTAWAIGLHSSSSSVEVEITRTVTDSSTCSMSCTGATILVT
jgi:hypothetical protein